MLYFLLTVIAIGVLLCSDVGRGLLRLAWLLLLALLGLGIVGGIICLGLAYKAAVAEIAKGIFLIGSTLFLCKIGKDMLDGLKKYYRKVFICSLVVSFTICIIFIGAIAYTLLCTPDILNYDLIEILFMPFILVFTICLLYLNDIIQERPDRVVLTYEKKSGD